LYIAQNIAAENVQQVLGGRNLGVVLEASFARVRQLTPQQRGLIQDLSYGVLRHYSRYEALLQQLLSKPLTDMHIHYLLLVALFQLEDGRAGSHTVVDQAVKAAAKTGKPWAKGLVNAVLRNFLRQQEALLAKLPENDVTRYAYPQWWIDKLKHQYPADWQTMLEAGNQRPPMALRVNRRHADAGQYLQTLHEQDIKATVLSSHTVILDHPLPVDRLPGFYEGVVSVQDYGAQFAARLLDLEDGMHVLDACCAPGGKTGHILELAEVNMLAMDSDADRLTRTQSNLDRLGLHARLCTGDAAMPETWWDGQFFDRILADVPCTASGIVRRHVDIKWLRREADIASFVTQQRLILPALWRLLAKGGKLLYVTCSVFQEENQQQVDWFMNMHHDAVQLPLENIPLINSGAINLHHGQLLPSEAHDGFFYALLQKH